MGSRCSHPARRPSRLQSGLRNETLKALQQVEVGAAMARQGLEPEPSTPAELGVRIGKESATWAELIKKLGIRVE
jgi:tripartite-type tricarboxylate transporter receptor subunit TctC